MWSSDHDLDHDLSLAEPCQFLPYFINQALPETLQVLVLLKDIKVSEKTSIFTEIFVFLVQTMIRILIFKEHFLLISYTKLSFGIRLNVFALKIPKTTLLNATKRLKKGSLSDLRSCVQKIRSFQVFQNLI